MINDKNLDKLYAGIINGEELTTKVLNGYGFNSKDLSDLIDKGVLQRVRRGYYSFLAVDDLYRYGKDFIYLKDYEKANKCFERCYILDHNHVGTCFQLFLNSINKYDYDSAFKYFEGLSNIDDPYCEKDNNFYLYLLNVITDVPEKYKEFVKYLKFEDICIDMHDKRYRNKPFRNKIRKTVFLGKLPFALQQLNGLMADPKSITVQDILIKSLLVQAVTIEADRKNEVIELIKTKQYEKLALVLEEKQKRRNLNVGDNYTLRLVEDMLHIQKTKKVPKPKNSKVQNMFQAIDGYNYELAFEMCEKVNSANNIDLSKNVIYLLLRDVCVLINEISNLTESKTSESPVLVQDISNVGVPSAKDENVSFSEIVKYLMASDMDNAFDTLCLYMKSIGKSDYEFLIFDLIKLSLIEKDMAFTKPMIALSYLSKDDFKFDVSSYIQEFYIALAENKFDAARLYLDIVCNSNKIDNNSILTDVLLQVLDNTEKVLRNKENLSEVCVSEDNMQKGEFVSSTEIRGGVCFLEQDAQIALEDSLVSGEVGKSEVHADIFEEEVEQTEVTVKTLVENNMDGDEKFIESKHNSLLKNKGIILLKPMKPERRKLLHDLVERYPDMVSFSVGEDIERRIVLRYKPIIHEYVNVKALSIDGWNAYKAQDYDGCIDKFLQLLQVGKKPPVWVYGNIGLCHLYSNRLNLALDYLRVANYLNQKENGKFDYTELINKLTGTTDEEDKKPVFEMSIKEFNTNDKNYGIGNINQITEFISETGFDVESACEHFGMNPEQIDTVRLIYAKDFYSRGWYEKGEEFLKSVEQSKNKTKFTTSLYREIQRDKRLYAKRPPENPRQLSLTLKPRKNNK